MARVETCVPCTNEKHSRECCQIHCPTCREECGVKVTSNKVYRIENCVILASHSRRKRVVAK